MDISKLNCFCRKYDLIFVEEGQVKKELVYWFLDFNNTRRYYTSTEINEKLAV